MPLRPITPHFRLVLAATVKTELPGERESEGDPDPSGSTRTESAAVAAGIAALGTLVALVSVGWFALVGIVLYPIVGILHAIVHHRTLAPPVTRMQRRLARASNVLLLAAFALQVAVGDRRCAWFAILGPDASPCLADPLWSIANFLLFLPVALVWVWLTAISPPPPKT